MDLSATLGPKLLNDHIPYECNGIVGEYDVLYIDTNTLTQGRSLASRVWLVISTCRQAQ
jgi:hypothetical protein